jgi:hypothetical protein
MIKTASTSDMGILSAGGSFNWLSYYFEVVLCNTGQLSLFWKVGTGYGQGTSVGARLNDNNWHTVLVTYDGTILTLYEDGMSQYSAAVALNTIGNKYNYLGMAIYWSNYIGKLKNVIFYDNIITNYYALANCYQAAGSILYDSGIYNL